MSEEKFYVYVYLDPRKPGKYDYGEDDEYSFEYLPYYVGKGHGRRWKGHLSPSSLKEISHKNHKINKILSEGYNQKDFIIKTKENMNESESLDLEMKLIKTIGRADMGDGPLTNLTDGGDGVSGRVYTDAQKKAKSE